MDNKGLIEYKPSFISKINSFFKNLFGKKDVIIEEQNIGIKNNIEERNFAEEIKVKNIDVSSKTDCMNKENERKKFLNEIDGNREALNKLSIEQLKRLEKYYDTIIEENNLKIQKADE